MTKATIKKMVTLVTTADVLLLKLICQRLLFEQPNHIHACEGTDRISTVPRCHHDLTALQQQEVAATLPSAIDFLNEGGQVLKALPPPLLQEEKLKEREENVVTTHQKCHRLQQMCFAGQKGS